jgi:phage repressor protein C with HTH and peptisase S24 domain
MRLSPPCCFFDLPQERRDLVIHTLQHIHECIKMQYPNECEVGREYAPAYISPMTIGQRLDEAMKAAGFFNQKTLEEASGVPQPTISRILKNSGKKGPEAHTVKSLANACGVSFEWLYDGVGMMLPTHIGAGLGGVIKVATDDAEGKFVGIKLLKRQVYLGLDGADADWEYEDEVSLSLPLEWLKARHLAPADLFAFRASGQSMYPTIRDGNLMVATRADTQPVDGKLFAVNHNGRPCVKRLEREGGMWYLSSDNPLPEYRRRPVDNDSRIIGRILRMETDFD